MFVKTLWYEIYFQYYLQRDLISFSLYWELIKDSQDVLRVPSLSCGTRAPVFLKRKLLIFLFEIYFWKCSQGPVGWAGLNSTLAPWHMLVHSCGDRDHSCGLVKCGDCYHGGLWNQFSDQDWLNTIICQNLSCTVSSEKYFFSFAVSHPRTYSQPFNS